MACCKCCCGGVDCTEGQQGKCCCGGSSGACCSESEYCCNGVCQGSPCEPLAVITYPASFCYGTFYDVEISYSGMKDNWEVSQIALFTGSPATQLSVWIDITGNASGTVTVTLQSVSRTNGTLMWVRHRGRDENSVLLDDTDGPTVPLQHCGSCFSDGHCRYGECCNGGTQVLQSGVHPSGVCEPCPCTDNNDCGQDLPYCCDGFCSETPCGGCESLLITYDWEGTGQLDLDTATTFLGSTVGFGCQYETDTTYMTGWTDNTAPPQPQKETVTILFGAALAASQWSGSTTVSLNAGWYTPAGGSGNITVRVQCVGDNSTEQTLSVSPGSQNGCASTNVATVTINANGTFTLNPLP